MGPRNARHESIRAKVRCKPSATSSSPAADTTRAGEPSRSECEQAAESPSGKELSRWNRL
jgi:hypothetical protein